MGIMKLRTHVFLPVLFIDITTEKESWAFSPGVLYQQARVWRNPGAICLLCAQYPYPDHPRTELVSREIKE